MAGPADADAEASPPGGGRPDASRDSSGGGLWEQWRSFRPYLALLDFGALPRTKVGWIVRIAVVTIALSILFRRVQAATLPMLSSRVPTPIPTEEIDDYRFRLPEHVRKQIFADLATAEIAERQRAINANTWAGHLWSREDDRGHYERVAARAAASKYRVSLTQVYLVLDQGIRERWPGPDGNPLAATTPPLSIRSNSW